MAEGPIGRSDAYVRSIPTVERSGSATDRRPRREHQEEQRQQQSERRAKEPPNPRRRRVYDMLFDEIDGIETLSEAQRARMKENIRHHVLTRPPPETPPPDHDEHHAAEQMLTDPLAPLPVDADHIVQVAAPAHPHLGTAEAEANRRLAEQLRACLALHTERARKVAVYLHVLLTLGHSERAHTIVDT